jgi:hypothetical protein
VETAFFFNAGSFMQPEVIAPPSTHKCPPGQRRHFARHPHIHCRRVENERGGHDYLYEWPCRLSCLVTTSYFDKDPLCIEVWDYSVEGQGGVIKRFFAWKTMEDYLDVFFQANKLS